MAHHSIFALSSEVVAGEVGLNIIRPTLRSLSISCLACPTILLASHPAAFPLAPPPAGQPIALDQMRKMVNWLIDAGALKGVDGILTGYMPSPDHVALCAQFIDEIRKLAPDCLYLCDPICGDRGRLYIDVNTASAIRDQLVPRADITTPNLFELGWLTQSEPTSQADTIAAARALACAEVVVTSAPSTLDHIATMQISPSSVQLCETQLEPGHIHGMGDAFAALYLGLRLGRSDDPLAVATATAAQMARAADDGQLASQPIQLAAPAPTRIIKSDA